MTIYKKALGADFNRLPEILQRIHGTNQDIMAKGQLEISYGTKWIARLCAPFIPLPAAGIYPVTLKINTDHNIQQWNRSFPSHSMISKQYIKNNKLYESFGLSIFVFNLTVIENKLQFHPIKHKLAFIPLPKFIRIIPFVQAVAINETSWKIEIRISFLKYLLVQYEGVMNI